MATITGQFNLTSNSASAATNPGPFSVSLAASITKAVNVDLVDHFTIASVRTGFDDTGFASNSPYGQILVNGSDFTASAHSDGTTLDHHGCYIYIVNTTAVTSNHIISIGHTTDADAGDDSEAGGTGGADLEPIVAGDADTMADKNQRLFSLRPGEFAWFPYDYTGDLYAQATGASQSLEFWRFDRV